MNKQELQQLCKDICAIDHVGVQFDDIQKCEYKHQLILKLDKMEHHNVIRLLMHVIHVQQLQISDAEIKYNKDNPFRDMQYFEHIEQYLMNNSSTQETLY